MDFIIGALGALFVLAVLVAGVVIGWKLKTEDIKRCAPPVTAEELTPAQKRAIKDQQDAWQQVYDYNVETAYGLNRQRHESEG